MQAMCVPLYQEQHDIIVQMRAGYIFRLPKVKMYGSTSDVPFCFITFLFEDLWLLVTGEKRLSYIYQFIVKGSSCTETLGA
ncbi:hypothetical protein FRC06_004508 [Ceratobasidium sp. 370]|nr:hypothetical protein FRC06_004508 [Ceratobasidium sp. 370]